MAMQHSNNRKRRTPRHLRRASQGSLREQDGEIAADSPIDLGDLIGGATGEGDDKIVPGGWAGTDDDTSTAPSDRIGVPELDRLSELTGGAISDDNPLIEGGFLVGVDRNDAIRHAEERIVGGNQKG